MYAGSASVSENGSLGHMLPAGPGSMFGSLSNGGLLGSTVGGGGSLAGVGGGGSVSGGGSGGGGGMDASRMDSLDLLLSVRLLINLSFLSSSNNLCRSWLYVSTYIVITS